MQQKSSVHAFLPFRPPKCAALAHGRRAGVVRPKAGACDVLSGSLSEGISWVILAFFVGCVKAGGSGARCAARGGGGCAAGRGFACERPRKLLPSRCAARGGGCAAGRGFRWRVAAGGAFSALRRAGSGGCTAGRSSAGVLQRRAEAVRCAAQGPALARGPRGAAAAFLASLMRR